MDSGYISSRIVARRFSDGKESGDCERIVGGANCHGVQSSSFLIPDILERYGGLNGKFLRHPGTKSARAYRSIITFTGAVRELLKAS